MKCFASIYYANCPKFCVPFWSPLEFLRLLTAEFKISQSSRRLFSSTGECKLGWAAGWVSYSWHFLMRSRKRVSYFLGKESSLASSNCEQMREIIALYDEYILLFFFHVYAQGTLYYPTSSETFLRLLDRAFLGRISRNFWNSSYWHFESQPFCCANSAGGGVVTRTSYTAFSRLRITATVSSGESLELIVLQRFCTNLSLCQEARWLAITSFPLTARLER